MNWANPRIAAGAVAATGGGIAVALVFGWAAGRQSYNVWGTVLILPLLLAANALLGSLIVSRPGNEWLGRILGWAITLKFAATLARYFIAYVVYDGTADAEGYNVFAATHYLQMRAGEFEMPEGKEGTAVMQALTTAIYTVIGPSPMAAFFVFASFALWGQFLLFLAFRTAFPTGDHKRYAILVMLMPSLLFWPASIGKESWLMLGLGVTAFGAARALTLHRWDGLLLAALGLTLMAIVRPHIAVLLAAALLVAQLVRPTHRTFTSVAGKLASIVVAVAAAWILVNASASFLGIDDLSWQGVSEQVLWRSENTGQGGSEFTPISLASPLGIPAAFITLLFRPFPWEASNPQLLLQSLEALVILVLTIKAWPQIRRIPTLLRGNPYLTFTPVYVIGFILAFAEFANWGILARQRVLMLPLFFVLLALPVGRTASHDATVSDRRGANRVALRR